MNHTTKTNQPTHRFGKVLFALPFAALLAAGPLLHADEPQRIFDAEKQQYVPNPDYHESVAKVAARNAPRAHVEPKRIFNAEAERFVSNPAYVDPAPVLRVVRTGEPRRVFDAESQQFETNPKYHGNGGARYIVVKPGIVNHVAIPATHTAS